MAQGLLLTDDELVALCALVGQPWPIGLASVEPTADGLRIAGLRGVRSLIIRGILTADAESGYSAHPGVQAVVESFIRAPKRIGAYIAPKDAPGMLVGAAITAVPVAGIWWMDSATAQGMHGFHQASGEQVLDAMTELAERTRDGTLLAGAEDASAYVCVIRYGDEPEQTIVVPGVVPGKPAHDGAWDRTPLVAAFAAAVA